MAKELSRTFDTSMGAVIVQVEDNLGNVGTHTIYVLNTPDVNQAVSQILSATDAATDAIAAKFTAAGWTPSGV